VPSYLEVTFYVFRSKPPDSLGSYTSTNAAVVSSLPTSTALLPSLPTQPIPTPSFTRGKSSNSALITSVVLGSLFFLLTVGFLLRVFIKRRRVRRVSPESRNITQLANPFLHPNDAAASNYEGNFAGLLNGQTPAASQLSHSDPRQLFRPSPPSSSPELSTASPTSTLNAQNSPGSQVLEELR
jgi:hypothetical protein